MTNNYVYVVYAKLVDSGIVIVPEVYTSWTEADKYRNTLKALPQVYKNVRVSEVVLHTEYSQA